MLTSQFQLACKLIELSLALRWLVCVHSLKCHRGQESLGWQFKEKTWFTHPFAGKVLKRWLIRWCSAYSRARVSLDLFTALCCRSKNPGPVFCTFQNGK